MKKSSEEMNREEVYPISLLVAGPARKATPRERAKKNPPKPVPKQSVPPKPVEEKENADYMALLSYDFILMLDCSPQPDEVFCQDSHQLGLACMWLNKLISLRCNTLNDVRMRNAFMSHLIVCLNRRQLTGIFREPPPQELVWVDFGEEKKNHQSHQQHNPMNPMAMACSAWMQNTLPHSSLGSPSRPFYPCGGSNRRSSSCSNHRHLGGSTSPNRRIETSTDDKDIKELMSVKREGHRPFEDHSTCGSHRSLRSACSRSQSLPGRLSSKANSFIKSDKPKQENSLKFSNNPKEESPKESNSFIRSFSPDPAAVQEKMLQLLLIIKKELSGDPDVEWNEFLEMELRRYREFAESHKEKDADWFSGKDQKSERLYLLLNMQKDLVRMLSDEGVKIPQ